MKNILVPLTGCSNDAAALAAAGSVAVRFQGRIQALYVHPDPIQIVQMSALRQFTSGVGNVELIREIQKQADERRALAISAFKDFQETDSQSSSRAFVELVMDECEGNLVRETIARTRVHDLVVLARATEGGAMSASQIADILVACGRPVLLVPYMPERALGATVALAWKDTAETARAVTAAMPFLKKAERIYVLHVPEEGQEALSASHLAANLKNYGVRVEARRVEPDASLGPDALLATAYGLGSDLIVTGAYSHSRFGELVFGGYTRHLLKVCNLPILMLH